MGLPEVCVVHLVWAPLGAGPLERFVTSYRERSAGVEHRLLVVFKEFHDAEKLAACRELLADTPHRSVEMPERKLDLVAYREIAGEIDASHFYFVNSESVLLDDGWLAKPLEHLRVPDVGLVGATGSHESFYSATRAPFRVLRRPFYPPFPNPHVRTNAFMIARDTAVGLEWGRPRSKSAVWRLESGRNSLTRQVRSRGLDALVVGRDGCAYDSSRWYESGTFRSGEQHNLLVADNRTRQFEQADPRTRRMLCERAWGRSA